MPTQKVLIPYKPNKKQSQFHRLAAKFRGFCGGWGNGKTSGGCAEFFTRLVEYPGTNAIVARKTRPELRSTTWDMLVNGDTQETGWRGIPKEIIETYNKSDLYIKLKNGSQIHGLPLDDPKKLENYNLGLFMIDQAEEVEEEILLKVHGRLRQHASPREGLFLFNPNGHNWLWKRFIDPNRRKNWKRLYRCVEATPFDNPNLPKDYLDQFDGLPEHWYNRFVLGSHDVFIGQIFTDFNPEVHVIDPFYIPSAWERWCCMDPGIGHEGALSWIARDYNNNCYYYREVVEAGQPVDWWAEQIEYHELRSDYGGPEEEMFSRLIGPEANQRSQLDGKTVKGVFEEEGITDFEVADRDPIARINRITSRLRGKFRRPLRGHSENDLDGLPSPLVLPGDEPVYENDGDGARPSLFIFRNCEYTTEHLPQYRWRPQRTNFSEEAPAEKPRKRDDHTVDNIGHILVAMGDSVPEVPDNSAPIDPELRELEDHFEAEVRLANRRSPVRDRPSSKSGLGTRVRATMGGDQ
jgi:phage terminase large subunit